MNKAQEILGMVLPADQDSALPLPLPGLSMGLLLPPLLPPQAMKRSADARNAFMATMLPENRAPLR